MRPLLTLVLLFVAASLRAQDNYEIQVYGSDTMAKGFTIVELHSNFTAKGYGSRSFRITASSASESVTTTLLVQGDNMAQVALPPGNLGYMTVTVEPLDVADSEVWTAYASSIDNVSGDAWLQNAEPKAK